MAWLCGFLTVSEGQKCLFEGQKCLFEGQKHLKKSNNRNVFSEAFQKTQAFFLFCVCGWAVGLESFLYLQARIPGRFLEDTKRTEAPFSWCPSVPPTDYILFCCLLLFREAVTLLAAFVLVLLLFCFLLSALY